MGLDESSLAARMDGTNGLNVYALLQTNGAQAALAEHGFDTAAMGAPPEQGADQDPDAYALEVQGWVSAHTDELDAAAQVVLGNPEFSLNDYHVDYENGSGNYAKLVKLV